VGNPSRVGIPALEGNPSREVQTNHGSKIHLLEANFSSSCIQRVHYRRMRSHTTSTGRFSSLSCYPVLRYIHYFQFIYHHFDHRVLGCKDFGDEQLLLSIDEDLEEGIAGNGDLQRQMEEGTSPSVNIWKGTMVGVIAQSGSGKLTFLRVASMLASDKDA
jgi:ABC-type glutathione transport system ATPase component